VSRLSIIIPVLGDGISLDDTLVSVLENRPADSEILVVHNLPYDDPYQLGDEVRFIAAMPGATLADCLNLGIAASRSPVVHVLACGVEVLPGWADAALRHFRAPTVAAVAAVVLYGDDPQKVVSAGLGYRAEGAVWRLDRGKTLAQIGSDRAALCGPDTLSAFYRKSAIETVGGFLSQAGNTLTGIEMALTFRQAKLVCVVESECLARVGCGLVREKPTFRRGCDVERLFWRWASTRGSLVGHAALMAGECVISLWRPSMMAQLAGRVWGAIRTAFGHRRPKPVMPAMAEGASALPAPHFAVAGVREERRSSRIA